MCQLLGVSRSVYYDYEHRQRSQTDDLCHKKLLATVREIAQSCHYTYGHRRMKKALNALGYPVGCWKTRSLMREAEAQVR
ncbi:HTH-like domain-containing protein [Nitrosomonas aestuarii]|uniref:HTH-like domain-containing protein n=1 Tax=Nitrosomonas aestuarii TaxID=52441 RepID=A0A1I3YTW7_9PROT|nr:HTH-like domain-containing protein [Nitrosomonas aestuarii]